MNNQDRLRQLMREHELSVKDVAGLLDMALDTVKAKLKPSSSRSARPVYDRDLEYLKLKLAGRRVAR